MANKKPKKEKKLLLYLDFFFKCFNFSLFFVSFFSLVSFGKRKLHILDLFFRFKSFNSFNDRLTLLACTCNLYVYKHSWTKSASSRFAQFRMHVSSLYCYSAAWYYKLRLISCPLYHVWQTSHVIGLSGAPTWSYRQAMVKLCGGLSTDI